MSRNSFVLRNFDSEASSTLPIIETLLCQTTQDRIMLDYPNLKIADHCPACGCVIGYHHCESGNYLVFHPRLCIAFIFDFFK